jgi:hypothetical protein
LSEFNGTDLKKKLSTKFHEYFAQWQPRCSMRTDGQSGRYDEASSHFSQFC